MGWEAIIHALWIFLPAYVANMSPVFTSKIVPAWKHPIDGGRVHQDGERMLGDGKTWRGLVLGGVAAGITALLLGMLAGGIFAGWDYSAGGYAGGPIGEPQCSDGDCVDTEPRSLLLVFLFGAIVGWMALIGDVVESYVKRRSGRPRGAPWFPFDQLDFVVFGLVGFVLGAPLLADGWVREALLGDWVILTTLLLATPVLHLLVNRIGFWLRLKDVPW